ncbi:MAG: hypothetical protein CVV53_06230 [Spirochaetae bacterium HGW-Spirochaetae-9]|nr:MAG: hypothetical protein CVV53_06230 [Spirochaetae bacterium HGW-Spirochaetae-9]
MKPEFELLVRCCGIARNLPTFGASTQTVLPNGFDEDLFVKMAIQHKTAATALAGLKKMGIALNPAATRTLKAHAMRNRLVREMILEDAHTITQALKNQDIPALVLKGLASSSELYGDPYTREYNDLDILVNLPNVEPVISSMAELGWVATDFRKPDPSHRESALIQQRGHHETFWKNGRPFRVEIHDRSGWEKELFRRDDIDAVFSRAIVLDTPVGGIPAPTLPDHALLILAHGIQHAWCLLHWLMDAAALLACKDKSLQKLLAARCRALDMQCQLKLTCDLIQRLYPINLPAAIESSTFCMRKLEKPLDFAFTQLQAGGVKFSSIRNTLAFQFKYSFPLLRNSHERRTSLFQLFKIPQPDIDTIPLPRPLLFLHLLLRPFFMASRRVKRHREKQAVLNG